MIQLSLNHRIPFIEKDELLLFEREVALHRSNIYGRTGAGSDFLGWTDPSQTEESLNRLVSAAERLRSQSEAVVVVGIGGSYLGSKAVIQALDVQQNFTSKTGVKRNPQLFFAGHHLDSDYHHHLLQYLNERDFSVIVISKSGTTTEPAIAFRLLRKLLEDKFGLTGAASRIVAITDARSGALKKLADEQGYETFVIPDDVGGRFSVLTAVGLLPIAVAGYNIGSLVEGAIRMSNFLRFNESIEINPAARYAVLRTLLYNKGKTVEVLAGYHSCLGGIVEWWKQLFGESEGKEGKGIFPAGVGFTTDLHSMGQYIQDGKRQIFETVIAVESSRHQLCIPADNADLDGLNFLSGKTMDYVNHMARKGTMLAHVDGDVPYLEIGLPSVTESSLGELIYFFEMACAISGYMLDVNPFDQPGVEAYKRNMFALLEKPGFDQASKALKERLQSSQ